MFYNNIRSVSANLGELEILIEERKSSIIALTETWFKNNDDVNLLCLEGYQEPFTSFGSRQQGGGVAIKVSECLRAELVHTDEDFESVSVKIANKKSKIIVSCFYCQPSRNKNNYLNHIEEVLERNGDLPQLVAGDFNIDLLLEELVLRKKLENIIAAHCLSLISLREVTQKIETSSSCIDAIFGNVPLLKSTIEKTSFSDHYSLHIKLDLEYEAMECIYRFRCLKKLENRNYSKKISVYLAHKLGQTEEAGQSGEAYITKAAEVIKRVTDKYFPCQDLKKFSSRKTWITNRIKRHIKLRDKLFQLWLNSKSERAHLNYKKRKRNQYGN